MLWQLMVTEKEETGQCWKDQDFLMLWDIPVGRAVYKLHTSQITSLQLPLSPRLLLCCEQNILSLRASALDQCLSILLNY